MSIVYNPSHRPAKRGDTSDSPAKRSYYRLRAFGVGETELNATSFRELFGVNGSATHDRIGEQLSELRAAQLVQYQRIEFGGRVAYRIVLELLPEELPENALSVPKSIKEDLTEAQQVANLFLRLEDDKLGIKTLFTIKDWQNCRRLLKANSLAVVKGAVKRYWETKADQRKNPNFNEFCYNFPRLANDARDEMEVEIAIRNDLARDRAKSEETHRDYLVREIKYQKSRNPERAKNLQKELEELDGEED